MYITCNICDIFGHSTMHYTLTSSITTRQQRPVMSTTYCLSIYILIPISLVNNFISVVFCDDFDLKGLRGWIVNVDNSCRIRLSSKVHHLILPNSSHVKPIGKSTIFILVTFPNISPCKTWMHGVYNHATTYKICTITNDLEMQENIS